jgi:hypothetical protein
VSCGCEAVSIAHHNSRLRLGGAGKHHGNALDHALLAIPAAALHVLLSACAMTGLPAIAVCTDGIDRAQGDQRAQESRQLYNSQPTKQAVMVIMPGAHGAVLLAS